MLRISRNEYYQRLWNLSVSNGNRQARFKDLAKRKFFCGIESHKETNDITLTLSYFFSFQSFLHVKKYTNQCLFGI